jgi:thioredoxin 1
MTTSTATTQSFTADVLRSDKLVLVDFWAEWCPPCRMVSPVLEEIADEHADRLTVVKVDADENPELTLAYGVLGLPTMALFSGGELVRKIVGARPKAMILKELADYL